MTTKLTEIREAFEARLASLADTDALEQARIFFLGKKGCVTELLKDRKGYSGEEKRVMGQEINGLKKNIEEKLASAAETLRAAELDRLVNSAEAYDITCLLYTSQHRLPPRHGRLRLRPVSDRRKRMDD